MQRKTYFISPQAGPGKFCRWRFCGRIIFFGLILGLPSLLDAQTVLTYKGPEPIRLELPGQIRSHDVTPDGSDVLSCVGGIYVSQHWAAQDAYLELSAENAVVFFSRKELLKPKEAAPPATKSKSPDQSKSQSGNNNLPRGIYLEGDVILQVDRLANARDIRIRADRLYYDFTQKKAVIFNAVLSMRFADNNLPLYLRAKKFRQWSAEKFTAEDIKLSNDEFHQPHLWLGARVIDVEAVAPDKTSNLRQYQFTLKDATMNVENTPVFWWPKVQGNAARLKMPIDSLSTSLSSEYGFSVESQWNLPWLLGIQEPNGVRSSLHVDEFTKRGPATGLDLGYSGDTYLGEMKTYLVYDGGEDRLGKFPSRRDLEPDHKSRGRASWKHRQYLPYGWESTFEISYLSDRNFLESWREREFDTEKEQETLVYFKKTRENWAFDFLSKFHLNDFDYTMTELPTAGLHGAGQDFFGFLTYYQDTSVSRLQQQAGPRLVSGFGPREELSTLPGSIDTDEFAFALSRHELVMPLHFGPLNLSPTVIGTYVHDESRFDDFGYSDPRYKKARSQYDFLQVAGGFRAGSQIWHVDNDVQSRLWNLDRMRHVINPEVSAFWVDSDLPETPNHDVFNFAIRQRWQTMRGPEGKKHPSDFFRLNTSVTLVTHDVKDSDLPNRFDFSNPEWQFNTPSILNSDLGNLGLARRERFNQTLNDFAKANWSWFISETTALNGLVNYNIRKGEISQTNMALAVQRSGLTRYYIGHRFLQNGDPFRKGDANFLTAGISYKINRKYTIALNQQYDIQYTAAAYTRATFIRKFPHWFGAFSIGYDATRSGTSLMLTFWPEGLENIVIGSRRFTRLAP